MRPMTPQERATLEALLRQSPGLRARLREGFENFVVTWAATMLALVVLWAGLAWIVRKLSGTDIGMSSDWAAPILGAMLAAMAVFAFISTVLWLRSWPDERPALRADLLRDEVDEEALVLSEAKLFRDDGDGVLLYCMRSADGRIWPHDDTRPRTHGPDESSPPFEPRATMQLVRAPGTRRVLTEAYSGELLPVPSPIDIDSAAASWPRAHEFWSADWNQLAQHLVPPPPTR